MEVSSVGTGPEVVASAGRFNPVELEFLREKLWPGDLSAKIKFSFVVDNFVVVDSTEF